MVSRFSLWVRPRSAAEVAGRLSLWAGAIRVDVVGTVIELI